MAGSREFRPNQMNTSTAHHRPATCLLSGEFCDRETEQSYRLASYETYRRHTWQVATLILIALTALNLVDYFYAADTQGILTFTILRYAMLALPAAMIWTALNRAPYKVIDWTVLIFALWIVGDSILMIHVFRDQPLMMAARLPLYAMIGNIMFAFGALQRAIMNGLAWPAFLLAFWLMTPDPLNVVPAVTVILSVAFMFGIVAGTWLARLRRYDYYRATQQDLTNRNLTQYKQELEQAILAKTMFLSNVSHELRTPLNAIIGFSDMIKMQMYGPIGSPKYQEYVQDIQNSGHHLLALINDILDLNRLEAGGASMTPEWISVDEAGRECRKVVLAAHRNLDAGRIALDLDDSLQVRFDQRALHQILINLVTNAVKYAGTAAEIRIEARTTIDGNLSITVTDDGVGMEEATIARLMKPFEQADASTARSSDGWGLGLPLANALAAANDAELNLESAPGQGTRVSLTVPADRARLNAQVPQATVALSA